MDPLRRSISHIVVAIPARDEAESIRRCLDSVDVAASNVSTPVEVVVAADSCTDGTARIAGATRVHHCRVSTIEGDWRCAGGARRAAVERGRSAARVIPGALWIANTDADSAVTPTWLLDQLLLTAAYDAVAGVVDLDPGEVSADLIGSFRASYASGGGAHRHVHGANLGVRADAYLAAGGWCRTTSVGEDRALWHALAIAGARQVQTTSVRVITSGRTRSRVEGGFAADLRRLAGAPDEAAKQAGPSSGEGGPTDEVEAA